MIILASGVAVAVWEGSGSKASFNGIMLCLIGEYFGRILHTTLAILHAVYGLLTPCRSFRSGTICNGLMMTSSGKLMSEKVDVLRLTFYTAPICCFVLVPFYVRVRLRLIGNCLIICAGWMAPG